MDFKEFSELPLDEKISLAQGKPPRESGRYTPNDQRRTDTTASGGRIHAGTVYSGVDKPKPKPTAAPAKPVKKPSVLDRVRSSMTKEDVDALTEDSHLSMAKDAKSEEEFHSHMLNHHMELMHAHKALGDSHTSENHADRAKHHADKLSGLGDKVKFNEDTELDESKDSMGYLTPAERAKELARRKAKIAANATPASKKFVDDSMKNEGTGSLKPGWMLKQDPALAKKLKDKIDLAKKRQATYGDKSAGKSVVTEMTTAERDAKFKALADKEAAERKAYVDKHGEKATKQNTDLPPSHPKSAESLAKMKEESHAPVAPTLDRKYIKGTPEHKAYKATKKPINGHPTDKMKEDTMPQSFKGFLTSLTELTGNQKKIDKNKNGKIDAHDFKLLRKEDSKCCEGCGMEEAKCECTEMTEDTINEVNHREFASQGKMHPDMAKHMKTGQEMDFYHSKTGDKISGVVTKNDGKSVHVKAHKGETHKFQVSTKLDESTAPWETDAEAAERKNKEKSNFKKPNNPSRTGMDTARALARKGMKQKMKEEFNIEITEEQAADLCDIASLDEKMDMAKVDMGDVIKDFKKSDAPQFAGKSAEKRREMAIAAKLQADRGGKKSYREFVELIAPTIQEGTPDEKVVDVAENAFDYKSKRAQTSSGRYDVQQQGNRTIVTRKYNPETGHSTGTDDDEKPAAEKRGRGRPAGSSSGAKLKGSANKSDYRGIDSTTHSLHLPRK